MLSKGSICASSHKQKTIAKSSTEAELIAAADSSGCILGIRNYLINLGYSAGPAILNQDNMSTIRIIKNGIKSAKKLKYLDVKIFFMKDYIEDKKLSVQYLPTEEMIAKPIMGKQFIRLRNKLLGYD